MLCSKTQAAIALLQAITMYMPASAQHMMSQKPPKNVDLRCALAQKPDHRLAYTLVLCTGLQAVECSNGGGEQHPITALRLLKLWPVPSFLPADTQGGLDAEAAPEAAQYGGVTARPFHVGSHLGN